MENNQAAAELIDPADLLGLSTRWWKSAPEGEKLEETHREAVPSHLNTMNSSGLFQKVSVDKMSVRYVGSPHHGHDVGPVQANCPAPTREIIYYFEMTIKNAGEHGRMAIGFTTRDFNLRRQPGWEPNSCGYHGDDGHIYRGHGRGEPFGPTFTSGDTVGAGINYSSDHFFFTKNGKLIGTFHKDIRGPLYPTIAVHSQNEEVTVNFGKQRFLFNVEALKSEEVLNRQQLIETTPLEPNTSHRIIHSYLLHYGYQDTLESFERESELSHPSIPQSDGNGISEPSFSYALNHRKILRQLIRNGDIDSAFLKLREWYPQVVQNEKSAICFILHTQRFIEYIRVDQLLEAINYARAELDKFFQVKPFEGLLEETIALLAYEEPLKSCVGHLLGPTQREFVADAVNAMVLSTNPNMKDFQNCLYSRLEKLMRQLTLCTLERRVQNENQGTAFDLHAQILDWGWTSTDI